MQNRLAQLRRTLLIHAAMVGFALNPNDMPSANRAMLRHVKRFVPARMILVINDTRDLRDYVAAPLNLNPIADLHTQAFDLVHVV